MALSASPVAEPDPSSGHDALAQEHESLLAFLYAAPVGLVQTDLHGQVELVNAVTAMLLLPLSMRHGRGMDNLFELLDPLAPDLRQLVAAMGRRLGTVCDGLQLPLSQPGETPRYGALKLVKLDQRRLIATVSDITPQVLAEQGRQQAEERLRFVLQAAQVGDWSLALDSGLISGSAEHDRCYGPEPLPPRWNVDTLLARVHPEDREMVRQSLDAALLAGGALRSEFRVPLGDGGTRWLALHGHPLRRPGEPPQLAGVVLETTSKRQADAMRQQPHELEAENRRLEDASRVKSRFVATMTHELRSPLTSIIGFTELLRGGVVPADSPEHQECLSHIAGNGQHLLRLINDVLDLSKIEAGKLSFHPAALAFASLATEVRDAMAPQWQLKGQTLSLEIADGLDMLHLDGARLRQVLFNLLSNAVKFTPEGGQVTLRARPLADEQFELEVADSGIGIAAADLPRLFTEFQQLHGGSARTHEGTGLGLALTRRLVQAQGGEISVRSSVGEGSVFRVQLPRAHQPATDAARPLA